MLAGIVILLLAGLLFWQQFRKPNEQRNVILLFFSIAAALAGLWLIFDTIFFALI